MEIDVRTGIYVPVRDASKCTGCGLCETICPFLSLDLKALNTALFGSPPEHPYLGHFRAIYLGHATDQELRWSASSGGLATVLLLKALEDGLIDGAVLVRMKKREPLVPEPFVAKTDRDVLDAMGSKYCPVPLGVAIREALEELDKIAVVGLPCHIMALRKAEMTIKELKERVVLHIGLFCFHTASFHALSLMLHRLGVRPRDVAHLTFRGRGWPGQMTVRLKDGSERAMGFHDMFLLWGPCLFTPPACLLCPDATNELADISLGDAWHLPELTGAVSPGHSIIVVRTEAGERLLSSARRDGLVELREIGQGELLRSQGAGLRFKKHGIYIRAALAGRPAWWRGLRAIGPNLGDWLASMLAHASARLTLRRGALALLARTPFALLKLYSSLFFRLVGGPKLLYPKAFNEDFRRGSQVQHQGVE